MNAAKTLLALIIALLSASPEIAAQPPSSSAQSRTANFAGQGDWSNVGPTTAPTISASPNDRYGFPQSNPQSPPSITARTQNAINETAGSLRDGLDAGVRAAKDSSEQFTQQVNQQYQNLSNSASQQVQSSVNGVRSAAVQTGTTSSQSKVSNPFAPPEPAAPPTLRPNAAAPPPGWASSNATAPTSAPVWSSNPGSSPPPPPPPAVSSPVAADNNWANYGAGAAAPPLTVPQLPSTSDATNNPWSTAPAATDRRESAYQPVQSSRPSSIHSPLINSPQSTTTNRSAAEGWDLGSNNNPDAPKATIERGASIPSGSANNSRYANSAASAPQDATKSTSEKTHEWWDDNTWGKTSQPSTTGTSTQAGSSATAAPVASASVAKPLVNPPDNLPNGMQPPAGNSPAMSAAIGNVNLAGSNPNPLPAANNSNPTKPSQPSPPPPPTEQQPWMALVAVVLTLAGSLAANFYLGWSYLDARQKYQSLVRKTADTFRRAKSAAA